MNETGDALIAQLQLLGAAGIETRTIVDGGAFVGEVTAAYLRAFADAHVWAFEPAASSIAALRARYDSESRVTIVDAALADATGEAELTINDAEATNSLLPLDALSAAYLDYPVATLSTAHVHTVDLDSFCASHGMERLNILKLDVQGTEGQVISGARQMLSESRIDLVFTEFNFVSVYQRQTQAWTLLEELAAYGYRVFDLYNGRRSHEGQLKWVDAIFPSPRMRQLTGI